MIRRWAVVWAMLIVAPACGDEVPIPTESDRPDAMWSGDERDVMPPTPDMAPPMARDGMTNNTPDGMTDDMWVDMAPPDAGPPGPDAAPLDCGELDQCGRICVDLETSATDCGQCGRTCVLPNATAGCAAGACTIAGCEPGFFDADGDPENGCEEESMCVVGAPCETACGTEGTEVCVQGRAGCQAPPDICNAIDDDCDASCDEAREADCRIGVHRASGNGHLYTTSQRQAERAPFRVESLNYFHLYTTAYQGMRAVFLCAKPDGRYFLTTDTACEIQRAPERQLGYWSPTPLCDSTPIFRLYHPEQGNHFYTISAPERDRAVNELGYRSEGTVGHVWTAP